MGPPTFRERIGPPIFRGVEWGHPASVVAVQWVTVLSPRSVLPQSITQGQARGSGASFLGFLHENRAADRMFRKRTGDPDRSPCVSLSIR